MPEPLPLNVKFEAERQQVASSMELSENSDVAYMGRCLASMTYNQAFRYRENNPELWERHLLLDGWIRI